MSSFSAVPRGEQPPEEDCSIGGHLLRIRDGGGRPLPFTRLWSELSIFFMAGMENHRARHHLGPVRSHPPSSIRSPICCPFNSHSHLPRKENCILWAEEHRFVRCGMGGHALILVHACALPDQDMRALSLLQVPHLAAPGGGGQAGGRAGRGGAARHAGAAGRTRALAHADLSRLAYLKLRAQGECMSLPSPLGPACNWSKYAQRAWAAATLRQPPALAHIGGAGGNACRASLHGRISACPVCMSALCHAVPVPRA